MNGWIKLHRKFRKWSWYHKSEMVHLFVHLLLSANREPGKYEDIYLSTGQLITGRKALSEATGISEQTIRTILDRLQITGEISVKSTNKYSLITIRNYSDYQVSEKEINQQSTTNKKDKKERNKENTIKRAQFEKPNAEDVTEYAKSIDFNLNGQEFIDYYNMIGWVVGKARTPMKDWKAAVRTWKTKRRKQEDEDIRKRHGGHLKGKEVKI